MRTHSNMLFNIRKVSSTLAVNIHFVCTRNSSDVSEYSTTQTLKLSILQIELDVTMAELAQAQSILKETLAKVAALEAQFDEANTKKVKNGASCGGVSYRD